MYLVVPERQRTVPWLDEGRPKAGWTIADAYLLS
jgi:hypothetical protein